MKNVAKILTILDRETVSSNNPADMRRVMSQMACELRAAGQRRAERGRAVKYDGVGEIEFGRVTSATVQAHIAAKLRESVETLRAWGVEVQS